MTAGQDAIALRLHQALGPEVSLRLRPALEHQSNRLYDATHGDQHLIVKEYLQAEELTDASRREYGALCLLRSLGIAPRPVLKLPPGVDHGPLVVYEYMPGEMWDRRRPAPAELGLLADLWLQYNALSTDDLWPSRHAEMSARAAAQRSHTALRAYEAWVEANYPAARPLAVQSVRLLAARGRETTELDSLSPGLCFCRGDSRFANVIARPGGGLGLVD
jgi:hypothetical protein